MKQQESIQFKVRVTCMTFNHAPFIVDTMNGFAMQQTTFPFICTIFDDYSTDGEQDVIKKYLNDFFDFDDKSVAREKETDDYAMTYVRHRTNRNCYFAVVFLKYNHYSIKKPKFPYIAELIENSKYIALCEGDDYWTDPGKLQLQVDFLEAHNDYSFTCHRYRIFDFENSYWEQDRDSYIFKDDDGVSFGLDYKVWLSKTLTVVMRAEALKEFKKSTNKRDTVLAYYLLKNGKGYCFNRIMGVYTRHNGGICGKKSKLENHLTLYKTSKYIYNIDKNKFARRRYYRYYVYALIYSHGKLLFQERFEFFKFINVPIYIFKEIIDWLVYRVREKSN